jgi:hypothetical protein
VPDPEEFAMPEPVLVSVATAVASKAALDLYDLVKRRFRRDAEASAALEAATSAPDQEANVLALAEQLERLDRLDPDFGREVRATWNLSRQDASAQDDAVVNQITGGVVGRSFQGRDVHGDVRF